MKNFIKFALLLVVILVPGSFFVSCGNSSEADDAVLTYWCSNNSDEIVFAREIVDEWNKLNPGERVEFQPVPEGQSSEEVILAAVVGETTPDIYSNMWQGDVEAYAQAGVLVKLDSIPGAENFLTNRSGATVLDEVRSNDGHIYQVPWKINPIMMIYNKNYFSEIGLDSSPKTYSEFFDAASKITADLDGDGYIDRWFGYSEVLVTWWQRFFDFYPLYLAASNGAPLIKDGKAAFDNKFAVEVFSFLRRVYEKGYFPMERISARQDAFLSGSIAIRFTGPWEITHAEKFKPEGFEYAFGQMPAPDGSSGKTYTYGDPKNIVIFNTCRKPETAWRFIKFMISKENDFKLLRYTSQFPRREDLMSDSAFVQYFEERPMMKSFAEQAAFVKGTDSSPVLKEVFDLISQQYEACVIYGTKSPEAAVHDAAEAVNLLLLD